MDSPKHLETEGSPEINILKMFEGFYQQLGWVTGKSRTDGYMRPLSLRADRAQMYKELVKEPNPLLKLALKSPLIRTILRKIRSKQKKEVDEVDVDPGKMEKRRHRTEVLKRARLKDSIAGQFLDQQEIRVNIEGAGEQMARFTIIGPPLEYEGARDPTPIFLIPGAANDLSCVETLAWELALEGRMVIVVGYPDSNMGDVSEGFVKRVEDSKNYEAHSEFFAKALEQLVPDGEVEMWGFSTGAPIVAQMLSNPELSQRVGKAVLMAPASSVDQSDISFNTGVVAEIAELRKDFKNVPKYTFTWGQENEDKEHKKRRENSLEALLKKVQTGMPGLWKKAKVKEGGKIVVVSGNRDKVTKSSEYWDQYNSENPQLLPIEIDGSHSGALTDSKGTMEQMNRALTRGTYHPS